MNFSNSSSADWSIEAETISMVALSINFIVGLPTNGYVLWLIATGAGGTIASELFCLNLTVSEILFSLSTVFSLISYLRLGLNQLASFFYGLLFVGRPLFQCCVCVERYLAVVHPVLYLRFKPPRYRLACCGVVWLLVFGFCVPFIFVENYYTQYYIYLSFLMVIFSVMLFCCLSVLRVLKRPGPGGGEREREGGDHVKRRAFRIILLILGSLIVNYLPVMVTICLSVVVSFTVWQVLLESCVSFGVFCGFVQPLLFLHRAGKLPCIREL